MRAAVYTQYGPPEVVSIREIEPPTPGDREMLIKVHATTVNRTDAGFRSAEYFVSRFFSGLFYPKQRVLGCEFTGEIVAAGKNVTRFRVSEKVFGFNDRTFGGHAGYIVQAEQDCIAVIPDNIPYDETAAITEGAHYALCNIRAAKVQPHHRVLVYGATGAIGSSAVQLLKYFKIHVTAVCSTKHVALVKSLGADVVVDYTKEDYAKTDTRYDFVFDAVGKTSFGHCKPVLTPGGIYISTEPGKRGENIFLALRHLFSKGKRVLFPIPTITQEDVDFLRARVVDGDYRPVIDRRYPLEEIVDAYRYVETHQKTGNVIITVGKQ